MYSHYFLRLYSSQNDVKMGIFIHYSGNERNKKDCAFQLQKLSNWSRWFLENRNLQLGEIVIARFQNDFGNASESRIEIIELEAIIKADEKGGIYLESLQKVRRADRLGELYDYKMETAIADHSSILYNNFQGITDEL